MIQNNGKICPHQHSFTKINDSGEKRTLYVLIFTLITMGVEIIAGTIYGSMALLADGWHMSTHAAAFVITLFTYRYARKHANSTKFSFGTGKVGVLGGFSSAIALFLVAGIMLFESLHRLWNPEQIHFNEAILVAVLGLTVNLICAYLLKDDHHHDQGHDHSHDHKHHNLGNESNNQTIDNHHHENHSFDNQKAETDCQSYCDNHALDSTNKDNHSVHQSAHQDHNLKAAYMHVLADALTSVLAIVALISAKYWGLNWLDALVGIVGAVIITRWAIGLIKQTSPILLDASVDQEYIQEIIDAVLNDGSGNHIQDLHVWKVSSDHYAAIISIQCQDPKCSGYFKQLLTPFDRITHFTIEVIPNAKI